jgi:hypothetical protein
MGSSNTKSEIIPLLMEECKSHGFEPFHVRTSSTGYLYNRFVSWNSSPSIHLRWLIGMIQNLGRY